MEESSSLDEFIQGFECAGLQLLLRLGQEVDHVLGNQPVGAGVSETNGLLQLGCPGFQAVVFETLLSGQTQITGVETLLT
jgi:hypothetical protein